MTSHEVEDVTPAHIHKDTDDTYDVWWRREGSDEVFLCRGITQLQLVRRLIGANHNFGEVTIVRVERVRRD